MTTLEQPKDEEGFQTLNSVSIPNSERFYLDGPLNCHLYGPIITSGLITNLSHVKHGLMKVFLYSETSLMIQRLLYTRNGLIAAKHPPWWIYGRKNDLNLDTWIWGGIHVLSKEGSTHQQIQLKQIHTAYTTPHRLHKMGRITSPLCTQCDSKPMST